MLSNATRRYLTNLLLFLFDWSPNSLYQLIKIHHELFTLHLLCHIHITFDPFYPGIPFAGGCVGPCLIITQLGNNSILLICLINLLL